MFNSNNGFTLTYYPILQLVDYNGRIVRSNLFTVTDGYTWRDMHVCAYPMPLMKHTRQFDVIIIKQYEDCAYDNKKRDRSDQEYFVLNKGFEVIDRTQKDQVDYKVPERLREPYRYEDDVSGAIRFCDYPIKPMVDDQQDSSDIRLSFYPVLQVISIKRNTERQYYVKITDGYSVSNGILLKDKDNVDLLRLFDVITVKRHKIQSSDIPSSDIPSSDIPSSDIPSWKILQFCVIDRSHSSVIGMQSNYNASIPSDIPPKLLN